MPDIGMPPPPPADVAAQMRPPAEAAAPDLAGLLGGQAMMGGVDIALKVMTVEPLLSQLAREAPSLAPDVDQLLGEMKQRMSSPGMGMASMGMGLGGPAMGGQPPMGQSSPMGGAPAIPGPDMGGGFPPAAPPAPIAAAAPPMPQPPEPISAQQPGGPIALPEPPQPMGLMDIAMQLEVQLPSIGADDPTLLKNIQYFVAKMREEVPKLLSGSPETQAESMAKNNPAPTDSMMNQLPVRA